MSKHYLYKVTNKSTDEEYVGVTDNPTKRWNEHGNAESVIGDSMRAHGIEHFEFSIIGVFLNRDDAMTAEKNWIKGGNPEMNVKHRTNIATTNHAPKNRTRARKKSLPLKINTEKLRDNEHFSVLRNEENKICFYMNKTGATEKIPRKLSVKDLIILAPLEWWKSLLGIEENINTSRHVIPLTSELIQLAQQPRQRPPNARITVEEIQQVVLSYYQLEAKDMQSKDRSKRKARPRQIAMYFAKEFTDLSFPDIGRRFGYRDHTTVMYAHRKINELISTDKRVKKECDQMQRLLGVRG